MQALSCPITLHSKPVSYSKPMVQFHTFGARGRIAQHDTDPVRDAKLRQKLKKKKSSKKKQVASNTVTTKTIIDSSGIIRRSYSEDPQSTVTKKSNTTSDDGSWASFRTDMPYGANCNSETRTLAWFNRDYTYLGSPKSLWRKFDVKALPKQIMLYNDGSKPLSSLENWKAYRKALEDLRDFSVQNTAEQGHSEMDKAIMMVEEEESTEQASQSVEEILRKLDSIYLPENYLDDVNHNW